MFLYLLTVVNTVDCTIAAPFYLLAMVSVI